MRHGPWTRSGIALAALAGAAILAGGCSEKAKAEATEAAHGDEEALMSLTLISPAFQSHGEIPAKYTCEGEDVSPPLEIAGVPTDARSLVLIVDDPDAPDPEAPERTWVHWVLYDLPPATRMLPEGLPELPEGAKEGINDWKRAGYGGPCPPVGRHRYFHKLYALDAELGDLGKPTKAELVAAMEDHVIDEAQLVGTYIKKGEGE